MTWFVYYKALKLGDVATTVTLIDKGSVIVAILLAKRSDYNSYHGRSIFDASGVYL